MPKLTCGCLNVKIYAKRIENTIINVAQLGIGNDSTEEFFSLNIAEAQLDLEGIRTEQASLMKHRSVAGWKVHQCANCEMMTHAVHGSDGHNKLIVNLSLKSDPTIIQSLETSPDFSPLYKLVLHSGANDNQNHPSMIGLQSEKYERTQRTLTHIQDQLNKFIDSEKNAMEERIRAFEEEQRATLAALQSKVVREKNAMMSLVLAAQDNLNTDLNDALAAVTLSNALSPLSDTKSPDVNDGPTRRTLYNPIRPVSGMEMSKRPSGVKSSRPVPRDEDDDLFDLDDINEDDSRPFYISDDENEDTDDSSITDDVPSSRYHSSGRSSRNIYSASVPISVPNNWRPTNVIDPLQEDDDDRVPAPDMDNMAASIKALARSVHTGDGTELFGDLPRRRLNTMEMGKL